MPALVFMMALHAAAGEPLTAPGEGALAKIGFDLGQLDTQGLIGPPNGKRALDYEFCIPSGDGFATKIQAIDPSARLLAHSRGRIGCGDGEVLVLGNTQQPDYAMVLQRLAALPWVQRIAPAYFE